MKIKLWGVRGSIACPGKDTVEFGGNTACIEIRFSDINRLIIIDAGSGIRPLGHYLMENDLKKGNINTEIFITHTHWDHILGFPFFLPIYQKGTNLKVYGPVTYEEDSLEKIVGDQLSYRYFPVLHSELAANIKYYQLNETILDLGDNIKLKTKYLNHTLLCLGYRFEYKGKVFCTCYDNEPFRNLFTYTDNMSSEDSDIFKEGKIAAKEENEKISAFFSDADILIHDAQYTKDEYFDSKIGWGHSYFEGVIDKAAKANVKKLILFHHDPLRTDTELTLLEKKFCKNKKNGMEIIIAREGTVFKL